ncbi:MAG: hypothetical protein K6T75_03210 [Acetobacteraceae bacterium]|nr:hypothetical protein [Acetobacteraceae bacterium]
MAAEGGGTGAGGPDPLARWSQVLGEVPEHPRFLRPDELEAGARELAKKASGTVELLELGRSRRGRPILALRMGKGPAVLAYGFPHPNEPVGGMTLDFLSSRLARDPRLLADLGFTWYLVECVDPDAACLNQGWFSGPFSPLNYTLHYFRQPATEQAEWGFPIDYRTLVLTQPVPEVLALKGLIDRARPRLVFSLHNSSLGGVYFWMTGFVPDLVAPLHAAVRAAGLPLHRGEPEHSATYWYAPGILHWPPATEVYDYFARHFPGDAGPLVGMGASCEEYSARVGGAFSLVVEVPLFAAPVVEDTSPSDFTRREAAQAEIDGMRALYRFMKEEYASIADLLAPGSREATERSFVRLEDTLRAREAYLGEAEFDRPATRAEAADRTELRRINRMLPLGLFLRVLEGRLRAAEGAGRERLATAKRRLVTRLEEEAEELDRRVEYRVVTVQQMVKLQVASILATAHYFGARMRAQGRPLSGAGPAGATPPQPRSG